MREGPLFWEMLRSASSGVLAEKCSRQQRFIAVEVARLTSFTGIAGLLGVHPETVRREWRRTFERVRLPAPLCECGCGRPLPLERRSSRRFALDACRARSWRDQRP